MDTLCTYWSDVGELIGRPSVKLEQVNTKFSLMETVWEVCRWMEKNSLSYSLEMLSFLDVMFESQLPINEVIYASMGPEDDQGEVAVEYLRLEVFSVLKVHFIAF